MPRTAITPVTPIGPFPATLPPTALSLDFTWTAADASNLNSASFGGARELLVFAWNSGASSRTITVTSRADGHNRTGHISAYASAAGLYHMVGRFSVDGWMQDDGSLYLEASHADVKFLVVRI